ncbi:MAG: DUF1573 domain-containing protein [Spirochaetes bacterium]|nr:DUF1573 domain-containing protein [Spirochaetota bacterium]
MSRRIPVATLAVLLAAIAAPQLCADLVLPGSWDVGTIGDTAAVSRTITLQNTGRIPLAVRLLSSCSCLTVQPDRLRLDPGVAASVRLTLDPAGLSGGISKLVLAKVENADGLDRLLAVNGTVRSKAPPTVRQETECEWCKKLSAELRKQAYDSWRKREGVLHYYYSADCRNCTDFLDREIPRVEKAIGRTIEVDRQDIREPGVLDELDGVLAALKLDLERLPVLVIGSTVLQGEKEIRTRFEKEMRALPTR